MIAAESDGCQEAGKPRWLFTPNLSASIDPAMQMTLDQTLSNKFVYLKTPRKFEVKKEAIWRAGCTDTPGPGGLFDLNMNKCVVLVHTSVSGGFDLFELVLPNCIHFRSTDIFFQSEK